MKDRRRRTGVDRRKMKDGKGEGWKVKNGRCRMEGEGWKVKVAMKDAR